METRRKDTIYGKCRCCDAEGLHRDLMREYSNSNGPSENYYKMFMDCFNLFLSTSPELSRLICWACIARLRDATSFRTKVASAEQNLLGSLHDGDTIFINVAVEHGQEPQLDLKTEVKRERSPSDDELLDGVQLEDDGVADEPMPCFGDASAQVATDASEWLVEGEAAWVARWGAGGRLPTRAQLYASACAGFVRHLDALKGKLIFPRMLERMLEESERELSGRGRAGRVSEKAALIANVTTLLQNCNATPFKSKTRLGFPCFYCRSIFESLETLQAHQGASHHKGELRKVLAGYGAECLVVYCDVTALRCTLCDEPMPKLSDLKAHLVKRHDKHMHAECGDRVVPFKLAGGAGGAGGNAGGGGGGYACQVCACAFETFGAVERHMNVHYRNHVCGACGAGFVTRYRLKVHTKSMHVAGSFECAACRKVFGSQQKLKNHVDAVHRMLKRFKCPQCSERFSEYFRRQKHLVAAHGAAPLRYACTVCERAFDRRYTLSRHLKRDHLEERDYHCHLCTYRCFTNNELRVHMIKHTGERTHECGVCKKAYARKKTLREHMRIHDNDRRFACALCGQAFVQKCSLKGHVKTHHLHYALQ